ncbi:MAG TPA: sigma-70 family RNA polymerase sigma factor [Vicinamibacterales bacterium]|nr:sigma-70 family RNA polymerase sigma factor [Vicinamibacterales bacterium]
MYFKADATSGDDDDDLVRRARDGYAEAFGMLVTRYQKVMYTVALRMVGNAEDAQDVTQDAFVKAYRQLATFDPDYRFFSWLYRIQLNECFNALRARRPLDSIEPEMAAGDSTPFDSTLQSERREQIVAALQQLTPEYRAVVVLRHFAGQSYEEIAAALEIPEKTVKSRLYSARQRLGELLLGWKAHAPEMK